METIETDESILKNALEQYEKFETAKVNDCNSREAFQQLCSLVKKHEDELIAGKLQVLATQNVSSLFSDMDVCAYICKLFEKFGWTCNRTEDFAIFRLGHVKENHSCRFLTLSNNNRTESGDVLGLVARARSPFDLRIDPTRITVVIARQIRARTGEVSYENPTDPMGTPLTSLLLKLLTPETALNFLLEKFGPPAIHLR